VPDGGRYVLYARMASHALDRDPVLGDGEFVRANWGVAVRGRGRAQGPILGARSTFLGCRAYGPWVDLLVSDRSSSLDLLTPRCEGQTGSSSRAPRDDSCRRGACAIVARRRSMRLVTEQAKTRRTSELRRSVSLRGKKALHRTYLPSRSCTCACSHNPVSLRNGGERRTHSASQLNHIKKGRRLVRRRPLRTLVPAPSPQSSTLIVVITVVLEVEHVEQVPDRGDVGRYVG
jgi:hypothetical protein